MADANSTPISPDSLSGWPLVDADINGDGSPTAKTMALNCNRRINL